MHRYTVTAISGDGEERVLPNPAKVSSDRWTARSIWHQVGSGQVGLLKALMEMSVGDEYTIIRPKRVLIIRRME